MKKNILIGIIAFFAGIFGAFSYQLANSFWQSKSQNSNQVPEYGTVTRNVSNTSILAPNEDFVAASASSTQSVVFIKTVSDARYNQYDLYDFYFGGSPNRRVMGSGSGVIFSTDGYIVTNNHVIESAEVIEVIHENKTYSAKVVGTDASSDLAILKIEANNLPAIKIGSSRDLQVGEWVLAVGNPFNLTSTVTAGIVSAKGRNINLLGGQFPLESFIQTDAAINPGNSGGALVNMKGELVGINTAILSRTGTYNGYGFAVPVDIVAKIFNDIIQFGDVQKAFAGLEVEDLDSPLAKKYKIKTDNYRGAVITNLQREGVAAKSGLEIGDVVRKINEEPITGRSTFEEMLSYYRPGDKINLTYERNGQEKEVQITLENKQGTTDFVKNEIYSSKFLGADLEAISKLEKEKLGIDSGVRIAKIKGSGLLARLGLPEDFVIVSVNNQEIKKPEDLEKVLEDSNGKITLEGISANGMRGYYSFYF